MRVGLLASFYPGEVKFRKVCSHGLGRVLYVLRDGREKNLYSSYMVEIVSVHASYLVGWVWNGARRTFYAP